MAMHIADGTCGGTSYSSGVYGSTCCTGFYYSSAYGSACSTGSCCSGSMPTHSGVHVNVEVHEH